MAGSREKKLEAKGKKLKAENSKLMKLIKEQEQGYSHKIQHMREECEKTHSIINGVWPFIQESMRQLELFEELDQIKRMSKSGDRRVFLDQLLQVVLHTSEVALQKGTLQNPASGKEARRLKTELKLANEKARNLREAL